MQPFHTFAIAATLGLSAFSAGGASAADSAGGTAPVRVAACAADTALDGAAAPYTVPRPVTNLRYRLVNVGGVPARAITVDFTLNGEAQTVVDRGEFAPGVTIDRDIADFSTDPASGPIACRVTKIVFRDGTAWTATPAAHLAAR